MITKLGRVGVIVLVIFGMLVIGGRTVLAANAGVTSIPSVQTVAAGANFSVDISVTTNTPTRGMQFALAWDPTKVKCNSVQEGTFYKGFAQQNSSITEVVLPSSPTANNTAGTFPSSGYVGIALMGGFDNATGTAPGPTGTGNVFILNMTALSASGTTTFTLSSVQLSDNNDPANNLNPTITNGQVSISAATSTTTTSASTTTTSTKTTTTMTVTSTTATPAPSTTMLTSTTTTTTTTATRNSTLPSSASQNIITTTKSRTSGANTELSLGTITSLDISGSMDTSGILHADFLQGNIRYSGNNQIVSLDIPSGTRIVASDGTPVQTITIQPGNNVPSPPANQNIVSVVQFGPSGTTFSSPMTVVYGYDPTEVPHTSNAGNLALECFNSQTNQWVKCDYSVDIQNHEITAIISHFSLYAVMVSNSSGFMGVGWSLAGTIIIVLLVLGALIVYYFIRRTPRPAPEIAGGGAEAVSNVATVTPVSSSQAVVANAIEPNYDSEKSTKVDWDDILPRDGKKVQPFKTRLEITGGKIVIAGDGQSTDIEIINNPDSRVIISMEYDPELHPRGLAKIITLGSVSESENKRRL